MACPGKPQLLPSPPTSHAIQSFLFTTLYHQQWGAKAIVMIEKSGLTALTHAIWVCISLTMTLFRWDMTAKKELELKYGPQRWLVLKLIQYVRFVSFITHCYAFLTEDDNNERLVSSRVVSFMSIFPLIRMSAHIKMSLKRKEWRSENFLNVSFIVSLRATAVVGCLGGCRPSIRQKQLLADLKEKRGYWKLKQE